MLKNIKYVQACFDGAVAMNACGKGVQLPRAECFTHACRALWPGYGEMEASVVQAFSLQEQYASFAAYFNLQLHIIVAGEDI